MIDHLLGVVRKWSPHVLRQIVASTAVFLIFVGGGITFGFSAVMLPQLETDNSFPYNKTYDSWIASMSPLAMLCGCLFSGALSDAIGRRLGQIVLIIPFTIGWLIMGFATNNTYILIGRFITGYCTGAFRASAMVYIAELTDPKYRSIALYTISSGLSVGALFSHLVGKFIYWKVCCFISAIPGVLALIILMCLKESPLWLLSKGKIDSGTISFREFRGTSDSAEKELNGALDKIRERSDKSSVTLLIKVIISKPFFKSLLTIFALFLAVQMCGVNTLSFYAEDIFKESFSGEVDPFILMISTDCVRVIVGIVICVTARVIPRKITLVTCCYLISVILASFVTYLYLKPSGIQGLAVGLLVLYVTVSSVIPNIAWSFIAEIFPSNLRGFGSGLGSAVSFILLFTAVKITPHIISSYGIEVMYISFGVIVFVAGSLLVYILPDTNGKSLQEIEDAMYKT